MFKRILLGSVLAALVLVALLLLLRLKPAVHFADVAPELLDMQAQRDVVLFKRYVTRIQRIEQGLTSSASLFDRASDAGLTADERELAMALFQEVLDHSAALDQIERYHLEFWRLSPASDLPRHTQHFALFFAAYVEKLALGLALVDRTINKPQFEKLFDEGSAKLGVAPGAYKTLKWNVVHVDDAARALAAHQWMRMLSGALDKMATVDPATWGFLLNRMQNRYDVVKENLSRKSVKLFGGNSADIGKDAAHALWFPLQAEVATVMGDTKVRHLSTSLIAHEQVQQAAQRSEPGDILLERRNWFLSNVGLPGFWPHAALWLGTPAVLTAYFDDDEVKKAYGKPLQEALAERYVVAWGDYVDLEQTDHGAFAHTVIEAMSEGVVFTSAEHSIGTADYVAAIRPKVSKLDKARAIERAFAYAGRPYDFDFDFYTDESLVCSELVYKAYEPRAGCAGVALPLEKMVGRMTLGPNTIVSIFDSEYGTDKQQLTFAWFLDGNEAQHDAAFASVDVFRKSHLRPKWDIVQK